MVAAHSFTRFFQIRCTSNDLFRIRPSLGFLAPGESVGVKITFSAKAVPPPNRHFVAFYYAPSDEHERPARALWTPTSKAEAVKRLGCCFEKEDGTPHLPPRSPSAGE